MLAYLFLILGIIVLIKGADYLVEGSSSLAKKFGVPNLVIGLTIVAFGTSTPELIVSIISTLKGEGDVVFGNIIGSNMSNILLILGIASIIIPLKVQRSTVWKEIPFSLLAAVALFVFAAIELFDNVYIGTLIRIHGITLLLFFLIFLYYVFELTRNDPKGMSDNKMEVKRYTTPIILLMIIGGLAGLYFGGRWTVDSATEIARQFGLSEFLISATIVAVGTSLPELVTSVIAALKKDVDLAVGNIVGSNIFNIFFVLGVTAIIQPINFPANIVNDLILLIFVSFILFIYMFVGNRHMLDRWQGVTFLGMYVTYILFLVLRG